MRLKDRRAFSKPEVMIIPMIDIMFFLLVFFMLSTLYMVDLKTIPVNMPKVQNAQSQTNVNYLVTMKADGTLYLENKLIDEDTLLQGAKEKYEENKEKVLEHIQNMLPDVSLEGQWSVDIMQNGDDFWIIDMATADTSALSSCVPAGKLKKSPENWLPKLDL